MPQYFFDIQNEAAHAVESQTLAGVPEAKCAAVKLAGGAICNRAQDFWDTSEWRMIVSDEVGLTLFSLTFFGTDAACITSKKKPIGF